VDHFSEIPWFAWIPIVAIVGGVVSNTLTGLAKLTYRHRERMAMIQMGMHPDGDHDRMLDPCGKPAVVEEV
jgi:hypothetical protein